MRTATKLSPAATALTALDYYSQEDSAYVRASATRQPSLEARWLVDEFGPGLSVVDAGCGDGVDSEFLLKRGMQVYSFDASPRMVALATERLLPLNHTVHLCRHDQLHLPYRADVILALASLLFLPPDNLAAALTALAGNIRKGGLLVCSFKRGTGTKDAGDGRVFHNMQPEDLTRLARMAGLTGEAARVSPDFAGRGHDWVSFYLRQESR